ncbi:kelch repeat-containing protein [Flavihumibacter sp. UBA7668]|uniref:kelch repeat-containing protein n=1 Tax=Flavihumibacter sp. UBA7668 TaxID=1946542 RepID=UPI0025BE2B43|nr:kelch repeat-containing protein [Flavihumibacter sp. UBA7668]
MLLSWPLTGCNTQSETILNWKKPILLENTNGEPVLGLAGPIAGIHEDLLLLGGGANFPNGFPWEGGKKIVQKELHLYKLDEKHGIHYLSSQSFPEATAYGISCSTPSGLVIAGGEQSVGITAASWLLTKQGDTIRSSKLPYLPIPLSNAAGCSIEEVLYVGGGETLTGMSDRLFKLDLQKQEFGWQELAPLPYPVSHAVLQPGLSKNGNDLLLIGGRRKTANNSSDFYSTCYTYNLETHQWTQAPSLPYPVSAALGTSLAEYGILLMGGDDGSTFSKVETLLGEIAIEKESCRIQELIAQKNELQKNHPGFRKELLVLKPGKDKWQVLDTLPFEAPVTSTLLKWKDYLIVPSGEIKAGVRSPLIQIGQLNTKY